MQPDGADTAPAVPRHVADRLCLAARLDDVRAYWYLGFRAKGFFGYFRSWVPAAPWPILIILVPVEILKYVIVQPFTLGVRLFANMFAGHLLLSIFMVATWYLASFSVGLFYAAGSLFMVFFVFLLELLVDLLQAFIFTTLISTYIADSLEYQH